MAAAHGNLRLAVLALVLAWCIHGQVEEDTVGVATATAPAAGLLPTVAVATPSAPLPAPLAVDSVRRLTVRPGLYPQASAIIRSGSTIDTASADGATPAIGVFRPRIFYGPNKLPTADTELITGQAIGTPKGISYHSPGPVMRAFQVMPLFYGSWTATQRQTVLDFLGGLGSSTSSSAWMKTTAQYSDTTGPINTARGMLTTQYAYWNGAPLGTTLSDDQVLTLVKSAISAFASTAPNGRQDVIYMLLTGADVKQVGQGSFCTAACGWHTWFNNNGAAIKYGFVGNADKQCPSACISSMMTASRAPNLDRGIGGMVSVLAHEITEAASDPLLNAWYDGQGNENADKCGWNFGSSAWLDSAGKLYNTRDVNNRGWFIQTNWHPYQGACTMTA